MIFSALGFHLHFADDFQFWRNCELGFLLLPPQQEVVVRERVFAVHKLKFKFKWGPFYILYFFVFQTRPILYSIFHPSFRWGPFHILSLIQMRPILYSIFYPSFKLDPFYIPYFFRHSNGAHFIFQIPASSNALLLGGRLLLTQALHPGIVDVIILKLLWNYPETVVMMLMMMTMMLAVMTMMRLICIEPCLPNGHPA